MSIFKYISTRRLKRFWDKGIVPIKNEVAELNTNLDDKSTVTVQTVHASASCAANTDVVIDYPNATKPSNYIFMGIGASSAGSVTKIVPLSYRGILVRSSTAQTITAYWLAIAVE